VLVAEAIGTFALVFAGCGAIMAVDALFGGPVTGASMNPARSLGPALVSGNLHALWLYLTAPLVGATLGALAYQFVRGEERAA
jgi:glycerol uptake facilitator-like aquaporin